MGVDLVSLAARQDQAAHNILWQCSVGAVISVTAAPETLVTRWSWGTTSITRDGVGVYTFNFRPFDYTGTTYPLFVTATVGAMGAAAGLILFPTYSIVNQTQVTVRTWLHTGAPTELTTTSATVYDTLTVIIMGRRARPTSNGSTVIDPDASLLGSGFNLGVSGL